MFFGEAFVVPRDDHGLTDNINKAIEGARQLDWKMFELSITPVRNLEEHSAQG